VRISDSDAGVVRDTPGNFDEVEKGFRFMEKRGKREGI
jgi:hypothetical protein